MSDEIIKSAKSKKPAQVSQQTVAARVTARSLDLPPWKQGLIRASVYCKYICLLSAAWWLLGYFELLDRVSISAGSMVLVTLLFILSLPSGLLFDIDDSIEGLLGGQEPQTKILILLPLVFLNLGIINVILAYRPRRKEKEGKHKAPQSTSDK
jgi:hypothetical protein